MFPREPRDRVLSAHEIVRALRLYTSPECQGARRVLITAVASMCGLSRKTIYQARRGIMSERVRAVLSPVISWIDDDKVRFRRVGRVWEPDYRMPPNPLPPPQPRLVRADDWHEWARCQSCGSPHFSPFMADKLYFACDGCVGETDRRMLGARAPRAPGRRVSSPT